MDRRRLATLILAPLPVILLVYALVSLTPYDARAAALLLSIPGALACMLALSLYELTTPDTPSHPSRLARLLERNDHHVAETDRPLVYRIATLGAATIAWSLPLAFTPS